MLTHFQNQLVVHDVEAGATRLRIPAPDSNWHRWVDDETIAFTDPFWREEGRRLHWVDAVSAEIERSVPISPTMAWGVQGPWVGVAADGEPIVLEDRSIHNVYRLEWP